MCVNYFMSDFHEVVVWLFQTHVERWEAHASSMGDALWMSQCDVSTISARVIQCCCGIMSVQNKLFVDIMIILYLSGAKYTLVTVDIF